MTAFVLVLLLFPGLIYSQRRFSFDILLTSSYFEMIVGSPENMESGVDLTAIKDPKVITITDDEVFFISNLMEEKSFQMKSFEGSDSVNVPAYFDLSFHKHTLPDSSFRVSRFSFDLIPPEAINLPAATILASYTKKEISLSVFSEIPSRKSSYGRMRLHLLPLEDIQRYFYQIVVKIIPNEAKTHTIEKTFNRTRLSAVFYTNQMPEKFKINFPHEGIQKEIELKPGDFVRQTIIKANKLDSDWNFDLSFRDWIAVLSNAITEL